MNLCSQGGVNKTQVGMMRSSVWRQTVEVGTGGQCGVELDQLGEKQMVTNKARKR